MFRRTLSTMSIKVGETIPSAKLWFSSNPTELGACAVSQSVTSTDLFKGKKSVLFAVPGAFTPTCHLKHLPEFVEKRSEFSAKGVDQIICMATNDVYVMDAWGKANQANDKVLMVSDGNGEFSTLLGLAQDLSRAGFGPVRSQRFALIIEDNVVKHVGVGNLDVSGADAILAKL